MSTNQTQKEYEKIHMYVKRSLNGWFQFRKGRYNIQLAGDGRKNWFWLTQYAKRLWKDNFMKDFTEILEEIEKDNQVLQAAWQFPIAIFSLYVEKEKK